MSERQFEKDDEAERARKSATAHAHACRVEMGKMKQWDRSSEVKASKEKDECCEPACTLNLSLLVRKRM